MDNKKKIVFKINRFPQLSETFIVAQLITAKKLGFEVHLLVKEIVQEDLILFKNEIEENQLLENVIYENYKIPKNKIKRLVNWAILLLKNIAYLPFILKYFKTYKKFSLTYLFEWDFYKQFNDFDIIHIQFGNHKSPIDKLKKTGFLKAKTILTFHGHDAFFPMHGYIPNNGYYDFYFKYGNLVTVNTPYLEEKVIQLGCPKEKIRVIPVGVDTSYFVAKNISNSNKDCLKLITVGRLDKIKGQKHLITVVSKLLKLGCKVQLTIIGDGPEFESLESLIKSNNLNDFINLAGKKSQNEIKEAFHNHDIYVFTPVALEDGRCETQGLATIEAQASGIPAVVLDSGGVRFTVKDGISGYICKGNDIECVIEKIKYLYDHPEARVNMGLKAARFVQKEFSQNTIDSKWNSIYDSLLTNKYN